MSTPTIEDAARVLADPAAHTDESRLHAALAQLRANAPVAWVEAPGYRPFWAITKHADVTEIERANTLFTNSPRPVLGTAESDEVHAGAGVSTLIHLDGDHHRKMRTIAAEWFRPKAMRSMQLRIDELARLHIDEMRTAGGQCDFVQQVAVNYPLYVIMSLLGLPESDFAWMLKLTQELFGSNDDEFRRGAQAKDNLPALMEMFEYFTALTASRREDPTDDLASTIANARIDGELLNDIETLSYYLIIATAGHDTTSATISGGLRALIENADQRERLRADMSAVPLAVEEMIRWVTPVTAFMRTATRDTIIHDVAIAAGESVLLSYVSANRDEDVFASPSRFDITRDPNPHLAFGHGAHFCLGAALARMEIRSFFTELLPRLTTVELTGTPELLATTFVGGLKHLPISYTLD
jgi:cytochrome P450